MMDDLSALVTGSHQQSYALPTVPTCSPKTSKLPVRRLTGEIPVSDTPGQLPPLATSKVMRPNEMIPLEMGTLRIFKRCFPHEQAGIVSCLNVQ